MDSETARIDYPPLSLIDTDSGILIDRMLVQQRSTRRLEIVHRAKFGDGIDVKVRPNAADDRAIDLEIENDTGYELRNPVFVLDDKAIELGVMPMPDTTLQPGATNKLLGVGGHEAARSGAPKTTCSERTRFSARSPANRPASAPTR